MQLESANYWYVSPSTRLGGGGSEGQMPPSQGFDPPDDPKVLF